MTLKFQCVKKLSEMTKDEIDRAMEEAGARGDRKRLDEIQVEIIRRGLPPRG